jgi:hypothetical protein
MEYKKITMIPLSILKNCLFFDVETAGWCPDLECLREENPRLAKLWERRVKYYRSYPEFQNSSSDEIYLQKAGLEPEYSRIVCISFGTINEDETTRFISFYGEDEIEILTKTKKVLSNSMTKGMKLAGHNIKGFDVPCVGKRMIYNGIELPGNLKVWDKKPWEIPFLDTSEIFAFGSWSQQKYLSLDLLSCSMGVESPKEDIDGSQVHSTFWVEKDFERIKVYCEKDVETVIQVLLTASKL